MQLRGLLWRSGASLLDVGGGPGWMGAYLMAKYDVRVVAFEVPFTTQCIDFLGTPFSSPPAAAPVAHEGQRRSAICTAIYRVY